MISKRKKKKKTLWCRTYVTGYRFSDNAYISPNDKKKFKIIMPTRKYGYADPFPFIYEGKHYIFVEITDKFTERGSIGVCCLEESNKVVEVIKEPFHMSYPNEFEWNGNIYMIPETFEAEEIRLYMAESFPYKWRCVSVLKKGLKVVDFSFQLIDNIIYGIAYDIGSEEWKNRFFKLNMADKKMVELYPQQKQFFDMRPGGNFYLNGTSQVLPLQECSRCYGEYLHFIRVKTFNDNEIDQTELFQIKASNIKTNKLIKYDRIHTYNRVSNFETIDLLIYQFSLKKIWLVLTKKI